ncbi:MAG: flavodoxin family protein [Candidatus Bathyarchaeia archaeon]
MTVLGLVGSPRRGSNTDLLVSAVLEGASASNHPVDKVYLYDVDVAPCVDCKACKKGSFKCAVNDGMQALYPKLEEADVIVFGTPLYWYGPSAKMKLLVDRLRPFAASGKLRGKKAVLVIPSEEGAEACEFAVGMFTLSFKYLGVDLAGTMLPKASERAEIKEQPQTLNEAWKLGKNLK